MEVSVDIVHTWIGDLRVVLLADPRTVRDFAKAVQIDPNHAPAYTNRALALRQTNRNDQALADFSRRLISSSAGSASRLPRSLLRVWIAWLRSPEAIRFAMLAA